MNSTNMSANKMLCHLDRIVGKHRPITADIFLNNFCNNRCPYCVYHRWELDADAYGMTLEDFKRYAERLIHFGVEGFILTGGGEPTINKDFDKICEFLEENGIHYGVNSNFNVLKYIRPDYLKVSLDGWDEDSYEQCRGVRKHASVRENIELYARWKSKYSPDTALGVQKVITNSAQILPFYEGNKDLPFNYMSLRPVESTGGKYYASSEAAEDAKRSIQIIRRLAEDDPRVTLNFKWDMLTAFPGDHCAGHWAQIAVNEHGDLMYCCHKPYEIIGNIMDEDIMELYEHARTDMTMCDVPCRLTAPNLFLREVEKIPANPMFL